MIDLKTVESWSLSIKDTKTILLKTNFLYIYFLILNKKKVAKKLNTDKEQILWVTELFKVECKFKVKFQNIARTNWQEKNKSKSTNDYNKV